MVLELSGGNDGLNTLVPYGDDAYYRHRPKIGIRPESSARSTTTSVSARAWPASNAYTRTASWPSSTAADTRTRRSRTSRPWPTGTPPRPTAARNTAGSAASPMPWPRSAPPNFLVNIDARQSLAVRSRCIRRWCSTIPTNSRAKASTRNERSSNSVADSRQSR